MVHNQMPIIFKWKYRAVELPLNFFIPVISTHLLIVLNLIVGYVRVTAHDLFDEFAVMPIHLIDA